MECSEGVHYNAYYKGGLIAMAQALYDDIIEYEDGKCVMFILSTVLECSGVRYNAYYKGGLIAMAQALYDDIIEYEDGKCLMLIASTVLECSEGVHYNAYYKGGLISDVFQKKTFQTRKICHIALII